MVIFAFSKRLSLAAPLMWLASGVPAQTTPQQPVAPASYPSAFDGYTPFTDEPVGNWAAANHNVARIGGWREYAKQVQGLPTKLDPNPAPNTAPATSQGQVKPKAAP